MKFLKQTKTTRHHLAQSLNWLFHQHAASRFLPAWMPDLTQPSMRARHSQAGGRASDDAIRSLVISYKLLGTKEWFVIHHSNCGMEFFTDEVIRGLLANSLETAALGAEGFYDVGTGPGSAEAKYIDWLTISEQSQSVTEDVARIKAHPLVPKGIPVYGYIYDVTSGRLIEVPTATEAGRAK
jgi:carbonic anhydrase